MPNCLLGISGHAQDRHAGAQHRGPQPEPCAGITHISRSLHVLDGSNSTLLDCEVPKEVATGLWAALWPQECAKVVECVRVGRGGRSGCLVPLHSSLRVGAQQLVG